MNFEQVNRFYFDVVKNLQSSGKSHVNENFVRNETRVYNQSLRHNIWMEEVDIIKDKFPNENDSIQKYRNKNKRQFTKEVPRKIVQGIVSTLSNIPIQVISENEKFNAWIQSNPFFYNGDRLDFIRWSINALIPYSFIDPNAILVPFPKFIDQFTPVEIVPKIVPFNMRAIDKSGEFAIIIDEETNNFYACDKTEWYYVTTGQNNSFELIYTHNLGELPFVYLPGLWSFDHKEKKQYSESILASTYEYLDEALVAFATDQAIRLKMNSILIRPGLKCGAGCDNGLITEQKTGRQVDCKSCGGTGLAKRPSDLDDFVIPPADSLQGENKIPVEPKYINPDTGVAEFHSKTWKEFLYEAKKSVGIDALIDKSESGEAMKKRLASFEEFISYLLYLTYKSSCTKFFELVHKLLNINQAEWVNFPMVQTPKRIEIKTPEILKQNFSNAIGGERVQAAIQYYQSIYQDDPVMLRTMQILVEYYPSSIEDAANFETFILTGVYTRQEIAKGRRAATIIKRIIEGQGTQELTDQRIVELAEEELNRIIPERIELAQ